MRQTARVCRLLPEGSAELLVLRKSACAGDCGTCGGCGAAQRSLRLTAENPIRAEEGSTVYVESATAPVLKAAVLVYLLPLILFLAGYFLAAPLGSWAYAVGLGSFALGLIPAIRFDRKLRKRPIKYVIVGYVR